MIQRNSTLAVLRESFVAGSDENLSPIMHHLWKMEGGAIYFCRSGWAHVTIDLKEYEIVKNTQVVLLPGSIIRINGSSSDFTASFFGFQRYVSGSLPAVRTDLLPLYEGKTVLCTSR